MKLSDEPGALLSFSPAEAVRMTRPTDRQQWADFYTAVYWRMYHDDAPDAARLLPYVEAFAPYKSTLD